METLTTKEVAVLLGKSERAISRYIKKGALTAQKLKNEDGRVENRFDPTEVQALKEKNHQQEPLIDSTTDTRQTQDKTVSVVSVLQEQIADQREQLKKKDIQIEKLLDRQQETNVLLQQAQQASLPAPKSTPDTTQDDTTDMSYDNQTDTQDDTTDIQDRVSEVKNNRKWYYLWLFR